MTVLKKLVTVFVVMCVLVLSGGLFAVEKQDVKQDGSGKKLININTAGAEELVKLPRIGEKMAQRIIEHRQQNGKFKRLEDLMNVKGIGEKTFKNFEGLITL